VLAISCYACQDILFEEEPANDPIGNFESIWTTFNERYAVFKQRKVNWQALYEQYRPQINEETNDDELFEVITNLLSHLDDAHVSLMANNKPFWNGNQNARARKDIDLFNFDVIRNQYLTSSITNIHNQYFYSTIGDDIAYLYVHSLSGGKPTFIDDFIQKMQDKKGIIIDVRHNDGGDFTNAAHIASRFASARTLAFSAIPKNGTGPNDYGDEVAYFIEADGPSQYTKPVVVLTNGYTVSAAENFVLYFRVLPNVMVVGENTIGAMGERIEKEMPNGWFYSITGQVIEAADGKSYEGPGIPPDIYQKNTLEALESGIDNILEVAIENIEN
jgi:C-terminal processing protease CtpA/Prc